MYRVADHPLDVLIVIGGIGFVSGAEIEDPAVAPPPGGAAPEHLTAREPGDEDQFIRSGDAKRLAVHLLRRQLEIVAQAGRDRVRRTHVPQALPVVRFAPFQRTGIAHQRPEDLGVVRRVQHDEAHALEHPAMHAGNHLVLNLGVGQVAPPREHVGFLKDGGGQSVGRFVKRRGADGETRVGAERRRDGLVHAMRVQGGHRGILPLVAIFAPDGDMDLFDDGHRVRRVSSGTVQRFISRREAGLLRGERLLCGPESRIRREDAGR